MKKSDITMIILIASISVLIAYFAGKALIGDARSTSVKVKVADAITSNVKEPNPTVFNDKAINPTIEVIIGSGQSTQ